MMNTKQMTEFRAVVLQCSSGKFRSINVASKTRSDAIIAAWDEIERLRIFADDIANIRPVYCLTDETYLCSQCGSEWGRDKPVFHYQECIIEQAVIALEGGE